MAQIVLGAARSGIEITRLRAQDQDHTHAWTRDELQGSRQGLSPLGGTKHVRRSAPQPRHKADINAVTIPQLRHSLVSYPRIILCLVSHRFRPFHSVPSQRRPSNIL